MQSRIFRVRQNAMIAGVCTGLGYYLGIDPTWVRIFFILLALAGNGIGVMIYLLLWIIIPLEDQDRDTTFSDRVHTGSQEIADHARQMGQEFREIVRQPDSRAGVVIGIALILIGGFYLLQNLNLSWLRWFNFDLLWPVLLIIGGIALLVRRARGE
ncbi:MAG: PspC domain-containing protein [Anaerolineales bacterium]|jgi:phage shock protein C